MALSTAAATSAVIRNLMKDGENSFEPVGYRFGRDRVQYEEMAKAYLGDKTRLSHTTIDGADWDEVFETFQDDEDEAPAADQAPELAAGTHVTTPEGATGTTTNTPALTPVGYVVSVQYDPEFAHLAASGGADYIVRDLTVTPAPAAAPEAPAATGWDGDHYHGYAVMAADGGRVWHLSPRNDEAVCSAKVDAHVGLEGAVKLGGICAKCSRYLDKHGDYVPYAERVAPAPAPAPAAPAAAPKGARASLGASSAIGWDLLYDKPKAGAEVGRRYVEGKPEFALICKTHGHAHRLAKLSDEGGVRKAGGWCPTCSK